MRLSAEFYGGDTLTVARELLGKRLVRSIAGSPESPSDRLLAGRIVEVEAYVGTADLACHASHGRTPRTEVMFGPPGRAYVYLIYGMYHCLNVITEPAGFPAAVLIRALEPLADLPLGTRLDGPGRLCRALEIDRRLDGAPLFGEDAASLWIDDGDPADGSEEPGIRATGLPDEAVAAGPRVGVDYAGEWTDLPWRFWVAGSRWVSRPGKRGAKPSRRATLDDRHSDEAPRKPTACSSPT